ncbi:hypothetical protein [Hugenholtzia roseola]|uniref:hypothetical protein n=1 Tax=Hugenholtzia roseola TaxID=1002 RepID=UPI0003FAB65A|nr:hypothetical protein [Hugenholtzia roseola]
MKTKFFLVLCWICWATASALAQEDPASLDGKYINLIQEVEIGGKTFKDFRAKFGEQSDWGLQEEQTVNGIVIPKGYWVYMKHALPKVAEETQNGVRVRIGLKTITQTAKAIVGTPKLYVWKEENPNPPQMNVIAQNSSNRSSSNSSSPFFKYEIWFPSNGYYDVSKIAGTSPKIDGTVKISTNAYLFQEVKITINYPSLQRDVTIEIDGLNRNDMPMRFPLGASARADIGAFSVKEGNTQIIPISSVPSYAGTESTGMLVIDAYNKEKKIISGYFEFSCVTHSGTHKVRGVFKNIPLKHVQW